MTEAPHESPGPGDRRRPLGWRLATPLAVLLCGALFAVSALNSGGTDLRPGRYINLTDFVRTESREYDSLRERVAQLTDDVERLTGQVDDADVRRLRAQAHSLERPAGLEDVSGAGITVVLTDSPTDVAESSQRDPNRLVVHQQDIQAVVNAMWIGGAVAVTIQGQRVVSTTGIKCIGNSVQIQGVPYPQPYTISAVGDPTSIAAAIASDSYLALYRSDAAEPDIAVGWEEKVEDLLTAPAYDGLLDRSYAEPLKTDG